MCAFITENGSQLLADWKQTNLSVQELRTSI